MLGYLVDLGCGDIRRRLERGALDKVVARIFSRRRRPRLASRNALEALSRRRLGLVRYRPSE